MFDEDRHVLNDVVEVVLGPDLAMPVAVGGDRELDRHIRMLAHPVEATRRVVAPDRLVTAALLFPLLGLDQLVDQLVPDDPRQEVEGDRPLVVPAHQSLRLAEHIGVVEERVVQLAAADLIDDLVVEVDESQLQLADDRVLVVSLVADQRPVLPVPRQVTMLERVAIVVCIRVLPDQQLHGIVRVVQERLVGRPRAVHGVEVEPRRPKVDQRVRVVPMLQARDRVKGQVVVEELADIGETGRNLRIVVRRIFLAARLGRLVHLRRQLLNQRVARLVRWQRTEHPPEPPHKQLRMRHTR